MLKIRIFYTEKLSCGLLLQLKRELREKNKNYVSDFFFVTDSIIILLLKKSLPRCLLQHF